MKLTVFVKGINALNQNNKVIYFVNPMLMYTVNGGKIIISFLLAELRVRYRALGSLCKSNVATYQRSHDPSSNCDKVQNTGTMINIPQCLGKSQKKKA